MAVMRADAEFAKEARRHDPARHKPGRRVKEHADEGGVTTSAPASADAGLSDARDRLIALIPSEAVALFILLIGLASKASLGIRLGLVALVAVFAVAWTLLSYYEARGGRKGAGTPKFEMAVGTIAFLAWTTSVPASPFFDLDLPTWVGPAIVAIVSGALVWLVRAKAIWSKPAHPPGASAQGTAPAPAR
jgi:hypothetical protein